MPVDPASLKIRLYPDPVLRQVAESVAYSDHVREIAVRMLEMMRRADGIGLAAPQVGLGWRLFVADVPPDDDRPLDATPQSASAGPMVFINPEILDSEGLPEPMGEGCLSLPGVTCETYRPPIVTIRALNVDGEPFEGRYTGLLGRCCQHEIDHLDGKLIIDTMNETDRKRTSVLLAGMERRAR